MSLDKMTAFVGMLGTICFAYTHPGHEGTVSAALAALWGWAYGKNGNGSK